MAHPHPLVPDTQPQSDPGPRASLDAFAQAKLADLEAGARRRSIVETAPLEGSGMEVERLVEGRPRRLVNFCSNDYLGLARDPAVIEAALEATRRYGTGAGASRLVTGDHPLLRPLERRLAALKGSEDALVFGSGYLANLAITPALAGPGDLVVIDALAHACLFAGARLSGARVEVFAHNDVAGARALLRSYRARARHALILTDGVFSMDGDLAPLDNLAALAGEFDAWLLSDDAHGIGILGQGRGSAHAFDPHPDIPLQMGTLSKAVGSYGGYLCASAPVCELLRSRARPLVYSTGLPPAAAGAALKALEIIEHDAERRARPMAYARRFCEALGLPRPDSPIVPVVIGAEDAALAASHALAEAGMLVTAIRPPTVPDGTARLRVTFSAAHTPEQVEALVAAAKASL